MERYSIKMIQLENKDGYKVMKALENNGAYMLSIPRRSDLNEKHFSVITKFDGFTIERKKLIIEGVNENEIRYIVRKITTGFSNLNWDRRSFYLLDKEEAEPYLRMMIVENL